MKVLVTGATGFLGRYVVASLLQRGHHVRAMVRPASDTAALGWDDRVEIFRADLREGSNLDLSPAFENVDALIHLAAAVAGDDETRLRTAIVGTERLLDAMAESQTRRLVHASSFSVYDWRKTGRSLTEQSPLEDDEVYDRDAYAVAKLWQERVVRRMAEKHDWTLTVLRPGAIWGDRNLYLPDVGHPMGKLHLVIGPFAPMKLTYVENCADLFATVVDDERAADETFNVVDGHHVRNWAYTGTMMRRSGERGIRVPVPYWMGMGVARMAKAVSRLLFGPDGKLPSILVPRRFQARFRPVHIATDHVKRTLNWVPPFTYAQALERCYPAASAASPPTQAEDQPLAEKEMT